MVGKLQEEEAPIDKAIVNEVIELTPEWWRSAVLEITYSVEGGIERYTHVISSLDGNTEPVTPSESLCASTQDLGSLFRRHGMHWKRARYEIRLQEEGDWKYTVDFSY